MASARLNDNLRDLIAKGVGGRLFDSKIEDAENKKKEMGDRAYNLFVGKNEAKMKALPKGSFCETYDFRVHSVDRDCLGYFVLSKPRLIPYHTTTSVKNNKLFKDHDKLKKTLCDLKDEKGSCVYDIYKRLGQISSIRALEEQFPEGMEFLPDHAKGTQYPIAVGFTDFQVKLAKLAKDAKK